MRQELQRVHEWTKYEVADARVRTNRIKVRVTRRGPHVLLLRQHGNLQRVLIHYRRASLLTAAK
jgi:hypothetical protein